MTNDSKREDLEDEEDEPSEEEIEQQKRSLTQTWKHDDSRELSDRDEERPLKP